MGSKKSKASKNFNLKNVLFHGKCFQKNGVGIAILYYCLRNYVLIALTKKRPMFLSRHSVTFLRLI